MYFIKPLKESVYILFNGVKIKVPQTGMEIKEITSYINKLVDLKEVKVEMGKKTMATKKQNENTEVK